MSQHTRSTQHAELQRPAIVAGIVLCLYLLGCALGDDAKAAEAPITNARTCAALAVYDMGTGSEWDERAARADLVLDASDGSGHVTDCGEGLRAALLNGFDAVRWQVSLALVDAAQLDGTLRFPDACPSAAPRQSPAEGQRLFSAGGAR